jgi:hypothetical protein
MPRNSFSTMKISPPYPQQTDTPKPGDFELGSASASSHYSSYLRLLACPNQRGTRFLYIR